MNDIKTDNYTLMLGECLERMREIETGSVDMVMADLPYGTTQNKWDSVIPLEPLWCEYRRVCKPSAAIVLTANNPFTGRLVASNIESYHHCWVWEKSRPAGFLNAKKQPMRKHEDVLVFCLSTPKYNPQGLIPCHKLNKRSTAGSNHNEAGLENLQEWTNYPDTILKIASEGKTQHPTQKPVALMEYLIRTYTNEGETVLDNTMGSGSTGVACINTGRKFIGIERDEGYFAICQQRLESVK